METIIAHVDGDAFFVACEQAMRPSLSGQPVVTGEERGIVSALSYEAKALGVTRGLPIFQLRQQFPRVIVLPGNYRLYGDISRRMFSIMRRFAPVVEEYGIDEGFMNLTGMDKAVGQSFREMGFTIKNTIKKELGISVSVGIATTKVLAKIASKWNKPDGLTIITPQNLPIFLKQLPIEKVWGVGYSNAMQMKSWRIQTTDHFTDRSFDWIKQNCHKPLIELWHELRGTSIWKVSDEKELAQSIAKTRTFNPNSGDREILCAELVSNLDSACHKARRKGLSAGQVSVFLKRTDFVIKDAAAKLSRPTAFTLDFLPTVHALLDKVFRLGERYRATGIGLFDLHTSTTVQSNMFEPSDNLPKRRRLYTAIDKINHKKYRNVYLAGEIKAPSFLDNALVLPTMII
ncbi:MAG: DNA polymerase IV [bacterium]|nr:DNA polymerase IV [bacterium]